MSIFGQRLKLLRTKKNITLEYLAEQIQTTKATLSRYENSKRIPNIEFAKKVADYFGVTTDYLYGASDNLIKNSHTIDELVNLSKENKVNLVDLLKNYGYLPDNPQTEKEIEHENDVSELISLWNELDIVEIEAIKDMKKRGISLKDLNNALKSLKNNN